jgi:hypothetical protein
MPSLKNEALYQQRAPENSWPRLGYEISFFFAISEMQQKIRILEPCLCFPERKSCLPEVEEIFPPPESYFPEIESVFPEREAVSPRLEKLFPEIEEVLLDF